MATTRAIPPSGGQVELRFGEQRAVVVSVGGGLRVYEVGGRAVLDGYEEQEMCSAARGQLLLPWPNRIKHGRYSFAGAEHQLALTEPAQHNAIHGLARWTSWQLAERGEHRAVMRQTIPPQQGYPFRIELEAEHTLGEHGLTVRTSARNIGSGPAPFGAGAHPYITVGTDTIDECTLRAPGGAWMPTDDEQIPTGSEPVDGTLYDFRTPRAIGETVLDTGYAELRRDPDGLARVELSAPDGRSATLWQDEAYPYLMLFTGNTLPQPERRRRGLGVEPMSCAPNAFASGEGLITLQPGESWSGAWGITAGRT